MFNVPIVILVALGNVVTMSKPCCCDGWSVASEPICDNADIGASQYVQADRLQACSELSSLQNRPKEDWKWELVQYLYNIFPPSISQGSSCVNTMAWLRIFGYCMWAICKSQNNSRDNNRERRRQRKHDRQVVIFQDRLTASVSPCGFLDILVSKRAMCQGTYRVLDMTRYNKVLKVSQCRR